MVAPLYLKWMLVYEEPLTHTLWLAKAMPRSWLAEGESVVVQRAPTAYGRIGFTLTSRITSEHRIHANLTLPREWAARGAATRGGGPLAPSGGLRLRLRVPGSKACRLQRVTIGGVAWQAFDATSIEVDALSLASLDMIERLADVWATFI